MNTRLIFVVLVALSACNRIGFQTAVDPCVDVDCSGHGECVAIAGSPVCDCEPGFLAADGVNCRAESDCTVFPCDDQNQCTDDYCDPEVGCRYVPRSAGTVCGDATVSACTDADTCDGGGNCLDNDFPNGTSCGDPTVSECTAADTCDGSGSCQDNHLPFGTLCLDIDFCNGEETCDGIGVCQPGLNPCPGRPCDDILNECVVVSLINLADLDGSNGFRSDGLTAGEELGRAVACGDFNGDGLGDPLLGAWRNDIGINNAGAAFVVFGQSDWTATSGFFDLTTLDGSNGVAVVGFSLAQNTAKVVGRAGDVVGNDGIDDILSCAQSSGTGTLFVEPGRADWTDTFGVVSLDTCPVVFNGTTDDGLGGSTSQGVKTAGDINDDGKDDFMIGAPEAGVEGEAYVVFGADTLPATMDRTTLNGSNGFLLQGIDSSDDNGEAVGPAGDVNGDGVGDLIVGARHADRFAGDDAGEACIIFGQSTWSTPIALSALDGTDGVRFLGVSPDSETGSVVSDRAGNANNDAYDDILIGAYQGDDPGQEADDVGLAYLVFGRAAADWSTTNGLVDLDAFNGTDGVVFVGEAPLDNAGRAVGFAGDVNGDLIDDIYIGAQQKNGGPGKVYVVFGRSDWSATGGRLLLSTIDGTNGFVIVGIQGDERVGRNVAACDVNGDNLSDLVIGAYLADVGGDTDVGRAFVVFGFVQSPQS